MDNTTDEWTTLGGVNGRRFTAANGNSIFLPAAGDRRDDELDNVGSHGYYWSSSLNSDDPSRAWGFGFTSGYQIVGNFGRYYGCSVRPVRSSLK
ncbi:MAG: hypothetical protein AUK63_1962 [bacterium P3]|nr:MAG: hypothetical protein AUK63_1962 [bacterium P3]KWW40970.1 MAG: hypothetical protein F083_1314 [bacterium F083]